MTSTALRVKELLKEHGWTTKVLAEKTGMSESYLTHIKNGTRRWNEDALRKIAEAFEKVPTDLFVMRKRVAKEQAKKTEVIPTQTTDPISLMVHKVPMMGEIPSYPSPYNNKTTQITSGYRDMFVPMMGIIDQGAFCLSIENNLMMPRFAKGDNLVISPETEVKSGDVAAVEYKTDKLIKAIMLVTYLDDFVVLEYVSRKTAPVALIKGKDHFRVIGKVVSRYQRI